MIGYVLPLLYALRRASARGHDAQRLPIMYVYGQAHATTARCVPDDCRLPKAHDAKRLCLGTSAMKLNYTSQRF